MSDNGKGRGKKSLKMVDDIYERPPSLLLQEQYMIFSLWSKALSLLAFCERSLNSNSLVSRYAWCTAERSMHIYVVIISGN